MSCRSLLDMMDQELEYRDSHNGKFTPQGLGVTTIATVTCALYCEYAFKTLGATLNDTPLLKDVDISLEGHNLWKLFSSLRRYIRDLDKVIFMETFSCDSVPQGWKPSDFPDVRNTIKLAKTNFEDWRYGYQEGRYDVLQKGVPKGIFAIAKGIESICNRLYKHDLFITFSNPTNIKKNNPTLRIIDYR